MYTRIKNLPLADGSRLILLHGPPGKAFFFGGEGPLY